MFNIGGTELLVILIIAFVVVGPKDLPKVAKALGRVVRKIGAFIKELKKETGFDEVEQELKGVTSDLKSMGDKVTGTLKEADIGANLRDELTNIKKEAGSAVNLAKKESAKASAPDTAAVPPAVRETPAKTSRPLGFREFAEKARQSRNEEKAAAGEAGQPQEAPAAEAGTAGNEKNEA